MIAFYKVGFVLNALISFSLGLFVLLKNPRSHVNVTWFLMSLCIAIWSFCNRIYMWADDSEAALFWCRIAEFPVGWISVFFAHFCSALVGKSGRKNALLKIGYALNVLISIVAFSPHFVPSVSPRPFFTNYVDPGPLFTLMMCVFFFYVIYAHWILYQGIRPQASEQKRNQIKYTLVAGLLGFLSGSVLFLPVYNISVNPVTGNFVWLYGLIITYAIVKHHLMDITIIVRKSVIYSVLVAILTATYFIFVLLTERFLQGMMGYRTLTPSLLAAFLITLGFTPLKNRIQTFVDRYFFKETAETIRRENERLRTEMVKAEQMKAVSILASGMAHEIKNPLTAVKTFVEHLEDRYQDADFRSKFKRIVGAELTKIQTTVQQLLTFAKPSSPELKDVKLSQLLDETLDLLSNDLMTHRVQVERHYNGADAIRGDPTQLKQAFLNLIMNSLDAMPRGGCLSVTTGGSNGTVAITIADTGDGVPQDRLPRLFEPFYTTKPGGTGLGLYVVKRIINDHQGTISIESQRRTGTKISVQFPPTAAIASKAVSLTSS